MAPGDEKEIISFLILSVTWCLQELRSWSSSKNPLYLIVISSPAEKLQFSMFNLSVESFKLVFTSLVLTLFAIQNRMGREGTAYPPPLDIGF
jgi:hypothetical protein